MYWWNVNALMHDFKHNKVTEKEKFKYFMYYAIFYLFPHLGVQNLIVPKDLMFSFCNFFIAVFGTVFCYFINKNNDNKNFIERILCFSVPFSIRMAVFLLLGLFGFYFILGAIFQKPLIFQLPEIWIISRALIIVSHILYYFFLSKKIEEISAFDHTKHTLTKNIE